MVFGVEVRASGVDPCNTSVPDYVSNPRFPRDYETVLISSKYTKTGKKYSSGANIYKDKKGNYYYVDRNHKGLASEIEIFNKKGNHLGTMKPDGTAIPNSQVKGRELPKTYR